MPSYITLLRLKFVLSCKPNGDPKAAHHVRNPPLRYEACSQKHRYEVSFYYCYQVSDSYEATFYYCYQVSDGYEATFYYCGQNSLSLTRKTGTVAKSSTTGSTATKPFYYTFDRDKTATKPRASTTKVSTTKACHTYSGEETCLPIDNS
jgi:hypothetical protein